MTDSNDNNLVYELLAKKFSSQATPSETEKLRQLSSQQGLDQNATADLKKMWEQTFFDQGNSEIVGQREVSNKLWARSFEKSSSKKHRIISISFVIRIAATFIILCSVGFIANQILEEEAIVVPEAKWIIKETFPGQKSTITLSDGTVVWLNSGSKLSFSNDFNDNIREIHMEGQAYFEVFKNPGKPFRVYCRDIVVEAIGTSFDINGYVDMPMQVSLVTGSVKVSDNESKQEMILKPGEFSRFSQENDFLGKGKFDIDYLLAWKDGKIIFKNANINVIIARLELWYGVKIENNASIPVDKPFTGVFEQENLENILINIGEVLDFDYIIRENNVTLKNHEPM